MAADGWYSGDNHIHPNYGGHYFVTPLDLGNKALAEDLNVANGMIANYWGEQPRRGSGTLPRTPASAPGPAHDRLL